MKVKLLTAVSGDDFNHEAGAVVDLENAWAKRLLESGQAEPVAQKRVKRAETRKR